jgi:hypothetical protein
VRRGRELLRQPRVRGREFLAATAPRRGELDHDDHGDSAGLRLIEHPSQVVLRRENEETLCPLGLASSVRWWRHCARLITVLSPTRCFALSGFFGAGRRLLRKQPASHLCRRSPTALTSASTASSPADRAASSSASSTPAVPKAARYCSRSSSSSSTSRLRTGTDGDVDGLLLPPVQAPSRRATTAAKYDALIESERFTAARWHR